MKQMRIKDNLRLRKIGSRSMVVREVEGEVNMTDVFTLNSFKCNASYVRTIL